MPFLTSRLVKIAGLTVLAAILNLFLTQFKTVAQHLAEISQTPPVSNRKEADAYLPMPADTVEITLVNSSLSIVSYMLTETGEFETLGSDEKITLERIDTPARIGFRLLDGGLTYAEIQSISEDGNGLTVEFMPLDPATFYNNPDLIARSLVVDEDGAIHLD
ncbi:MAG: hypothetical protein ACFBSG_01230 [Leptolyngbyaceae cyanobacterium]